MNMMNNFQKNQELQIFASFIQVFQFAQKALKTLFSILVQLKNDVLFGITMIQSPGIQSKYSFSRHLNF